MKVRQRLALLFALIAGLTTGAILLVMYVLSAQYYREDFRERMTDQARAELVLYLGAGQPRIIDYGLIDEQVFIYDRSHRLLLREPREARAPDTSLFQLLRQHNPLEVRSDSLTTVMLETVIGGKKLIGVVQAQDVYGERKLAFLRKVLLGAWVSLIFIMYAVGQYLAGRALKPVSDMVRGVNQIGVNNLHERLPEAVASRRGNPDELEELAITFNNLLTRLETSFALQKRFVQHASHELNTPLTSIIGEIEFLLSRRREPEVYEQGMGRVLGEAERLAAICRSLLNLAKLEEAELEAITGDEVDLWELLEHERDRLAGAHPDREVTLRTEVLDAGNDAFVCRGNQQLLEMLFRNLLENAVKYSEEKIDILMVQHQSELFVEVADRGIGIPEDELKQVGLPLFRASNVARRPGTGLGLALTARIVRVHGGVLSVESALGTGTKVFVQLPRFGAQRGTNA